MFLIKVAEDDPVGRDGARRKDEHVLCVRRHYDQPVGSGGGCFVPPVGPHRHPGTAGAGWPTISADG